jgi:hypothetical protein
MGDVPGLPGGRGRAWAISEPKYRGKILGKTGYISGVQAFSGVSADGGSYLFSVIANGEGLISTPSTTLPSRHG